MSACDQLKVLFFGSCGTVTHPDMPLLQLFVAYKQQEQSSAAWAAALQLHTLIHMPTIL